LREEPSALIVVEQVPLQSKANLPSGCSCDASEGVLAY